jgi:hypothetical protein
LRRCAPPFQLLFLALRATFSTVFSGAARYLLNCFFWALARHLFNCFVWRCAPPSQLLLLDI